MKTYRVGKVKSNHFELLRKVKNSVVCSNLGDTGSWRPLKKVWTNFLLLTQVWWWVAGEETAAVCGSVNKGDLHRCSCGAEKGAASGRKSHNWTWSSDFLFLLSCLHLPHVSSLPLNWPQYSQLKGVILITCIYWVQYYFKSLEVECSVFLSLSLSLKKLIVRVFSFPCGQEWFFQWIFYYSFGGKNLPTLRVFLGR